jgi:hypothetical protein
MGRAVMVGGRLKAADRREELQQKSSQLIHVFTSRPCVLRRPQERTGCGRQCLPVLAAKFGAA